MFFNCISSLFSFQCKIPPSSSQSPDFLKAVEEAILYCFGYNGASEVDTGHKHNHDSTASRHFDKSRLDTTKIFLFASHVCSKLY